MEIRYVTFIFMRADLLVFRRSAGFSRFYVGFICVFSDLFSFVSNFRESKI